MDRKTTRAWLKTYRYHDVHAVWDNSVELESENVAAYLFITFEPMVRLGRQIGMYLFVMVIV